MTSQKLFTTGEAAKAAGVSRQAIHLWIRRKKIARPPLRIIGEKAARGWTTADVQRMRELKGAARPGPKGPRRRARTERDR